jgi:hypothetical protein
MGEGGMKPNIKRGADQGKPQHQQQVWRCTGAAKKDFKPPTPGLEHLIFKKGSAADAAAFNDIKKALAKYAGVNFKVGSAMTQTAIEKLKEPTIVKPTNPPPLSTLPTVDEEVAREEWKYDLEDYVKKRETTILGRCKSQSISAGHVLRRPCVRG